MLWAQITILVLFAIVLVSCVDDLAKQKKTQGKFWFTVVCVAIHIALIWCAGGMSKIF